MSEFLIAAVSAVLGGVVTYLVQEHRRRKVIASALANEAATSHTMFLEVAGDLAESKSAVLDVQVTDISASLPALRRLHSGFVVDAPQLDVGYLAQSLDASAMHAASKLFDRWRRFMVHEARYREALEGALMCVCHAERAPLFEEYVARVDGELTDLSELASEHQAAAREVVRQLMRANSAGALAANEIRELTGGAWDRMPDAE